MVSITVLELQHTHARHAQNISVLHNTDTSPFTSLQHLHTPHATSNFPIFWGVKGPSLQASLIFVSRQKSMRFDKRARKSADRATMTYCVVWLARCAHANLLAAEIARALSRRSRGAQPSPLDFCGKNVKTCTFFLVPPKNSLYMSERR